MSFWSKISRLLEKIIDLFKKDDNDDNDDNGGNGGNGSGPQDSSKDFDGITILGPDIRSWTITSPLDVKLNGNSIRLDYKKNTVWAKRSDAGATVNANPWVILNYNGKKYCATWEWLRYGQIEKSKNAVAGDHIKKREIPNDWRPERGEELGFFVSGLIRGSTRNVSERTEIKYIRWE